MSFIYENELKIKFNESNFRDKEINQSIFYIPIVDEKKRVKYPNYRENSRINGKKVLKNKREKNYQKF